MCSQSHWLLQKKGQRMNWRTWYTSRDDQNAFFHRRFRLQRSDSRKRNAIHRRSCDRILRLTDFNFEKIAQKNEWIRINVEMWNERIEHENIKNSRKRTTRTMSAVKRDDFHISFLVSSQKWVFSSISSNRLS
jgi:hypothetical protein